MLTLEVRRLSSSASTDESEVIRLDEVAPLDAGDDGREREQRRTTAPAAAGTNTHVGQPDRRRDVAAHGYGLREPGVGQDLLPGVPGDQVDELLREVCVLAVRPAAAIG